MDAILDVTVLFTLVLAISFLIERFLEILKAFYDLLDSQFDWYRFWTDRTEKLKKRLEIKLRKFEFIESKHVNFVLYRFREILLNKQGGYSGEVPVLSGDLVRSAYIKVWCKIIGIILGILFAFWMNIDLIEIWYKAAGEKTEFWMINIKSANLRIIFSGVVIGLGSGFVHKFINVIERKRVEKTTKGALL